MTSLMPCWKIGYATEAEAKQIARNKKKKDRKGTTVYRCPACDEWHLTTISKRAWKKKRKKEIA